MLEEIWLMHHYINNFGQKDAYKTITYEESHVTLTVIELCNKQNIAGLPIHNSGIGQKQHGSTLHGFMKKAYEDLGVASILNITP